MKRAPTAALLALIAWGASGCATILNEDTRLVTIQSNPPGAQIVVDGVPAGITPATIPVSNSDDHHIVINGAGGAQGCFLESHVGAGWVVLDIILLPLLIPIVVDAITGEWASLGQTGCYVNLAPPPGPPTSPPPAPGGPPGA
jgi:hypothetical protein